MFKQHQHENKALEPDYARYEAHKAVWMRANPDATAAEYEAAMRENARECGF